jgi:hypothetical protein
VERRGRTGVESGPTLRVLLSYGTVHLYELMQAARLVFAAVVHAEGVYLPSPSRLPVPTRGPQAQSRQPADLLSDKRASASKRASSVKLAPAVSQLPSLRPRAPRAVGSIAVSPFPSRRPLAHQRDTQVHQSPQSLSPSGRLQSAVNIACAGAVAVVALLLVSRRSCGRCALEFVFLFR